MPRRAVIRSAVVFVLMVAVVLGVCLHKYFVETTFLINSGGLAKTSLFVNDGYVSDPIEWKAVADGFKQSTEWGSQHLISGRLIRSFFDVDHNLWLRLGTLQGMVDFIMPADQLFTPLTYGSIETQQQQVTIKSNYPASSLRSSSEVQQLLQSNINQYLALRFSFNQYVIDQEQQYNKLADSDECQKIYTCTRYVKLLLANARDTHRVVSSLAAGKFSLYRKVYAPIHMIYLTAKAEGADE